MRNIIFLFLFRIPLLFSVCSNNSIKENIVNKYKIKTIREVSIQAKAWNFIINNEESQSLNKIRVKKSEMNNLKAQSLDMVHEIGVPVFGVNLQFDPNKPAQTSFLADKSGEFDFMCTTYCGEGYKNHKGKLIVEE